MAKSLFLLHIIHLTLTSFKGTYSKFGRLGAIVFTGILLGSTYSSSKINLNVVFHMKYCISAGCI